MTMNIIKCCLVIERKKKKSKKSSKEKTEEAVKEVAKGGGESSSQGKLVVDKRTKAEIAYQKKQEERVSLIAVSR